METSEHLENTENKKEIVAPDKEEIVSLKENENKEIKEGGKKKKSKKISLQKLKLGTKPINISSSNEFIANFNYIYYFMRSRIRMISTIVIIIVVIIILLTLKGVFHSSSDEENNEIVDKKDVPVAQNQNNPSPSPSPSPVANGEKQKEELKEKINKKSSN